MFINIDSYFMLFEIDTTHTTITYYIQWKPLNRETDVLKIYPK